FVGGELLGRLAAGGDDAGGGERHGHQPEPGDQQGEDDAVVLVVALHALLTTGELVNAFSSGGILARAGCPSESAGGRSIPLCPRSARDRAVPVPQRRPSGGTGCLR